MNIPRDGNFKISLKRRLTRIYGCDDVHSYRECVHHARALALQDLNLAADLLEERSYQLSQAILAFVVMLMSISR
jgi:hypothetical protein